MPNPCGLAEKEKCSNDRLEYRSRGTVFLKVTIQVVSRLVAFRIHSKAGEQFLNQPRTVV